jgi:hypothetical protein
MTAHRDLKNIIRDRQRKTGESYTAARLHVLQAQAELLGVSAEPAAPMASPQRCEAAILKVNDRSVRARILGESEQLTFRTGDMWTAVPGQIATLIIKKRWTWRGDAYASGNIESAYILSLNPNDNQGVRFCLDDAQHELSWEDMHDREERAHANLRAPSQDDLEIN